MFDFLKSIIGIYPWRCSHCEKKLYKARTEQFALVASLLTVGFCVPAVGVAWYKARHQPPPPKVVEEGPKLRVRFPGEGVPQENPQQGPVIYMANVLHNADITQMSAAKLTGDVMIRLIRNSAHSFQVDPRALIELKKQGTPDDVIREMIEVTASYGPAMMAPSQAGRYLQRMDGEPVETGYMSPGRNGMSGGEPAGISVAFGTRTSSFR